MFYNLLFSFYNYERHFSVTVHVFFKLFTEMYIQKAAQLSVLLDKISDYTHPCYQQPEQDTEDYRHPQKPALCLVKTLHSRITILTSNSTVLPVFKLISMESHSKYFGPTLL